MLTGSSRRPRDTSTFRGCADRGKQPRSAQATSAPPRDMSVAPLLGRKYFRKEIYVVYYRHGKRRLLHRQRNRRSAENERPQSPPARGKWRACRGAHAGGVEAAEG